MKKAGLYIHFPFCRRACFYCHFFKQRLQEEKAASWLRDLGREMRLRRDPMLTLDTIYFGGGSPSLLAPGRVAALIEAATAHFTVAGRAEITLEANPEDLSLVLLKGLRSAGINRLSIGVQSFQDRDLRFLKRSHDAAQGQRAVALASDAGFPNLSLDQIIGLPTQTEKSMALNFATIRALRPAHVSVYILENVPRQGSGDRDARLYAQARQHLAALGYEHYEVSNFSLPGKAARHNLKYWRMEPYIGLGPSAAGFLDGVDFRNHADLKKYNAAVANKKLPLVRTKQMDPAKRRIITGLRLIEGIPVAAFDHFPAARDFLLHEGFLVRRGKNIAVPPERILLLNEVLGYFM